MKANAFRIAVMPGEGIGGEVMAAALAVLDAVEARFGIAFTTDAIPGGAHHYKDTGAILPPDGMARA
jgi:3-isopropylmalate dehydrogenase